MLVKKSLRFTFEQLLQSHHKSLSYGRIKEDESWRKSALNIPLCDDVCIPSDVYGSP